MPGPWSIACVYEQWTLDRWNSVLWSDESKCEIFVSNCHVFLRRRVGERMISTCVFPTMKPGGGGVKVLGCFAGDTVSDLFRIQVTQPAWVPQHSAVIRHPIWFALSGTVVCFLTTQHTFRRCKGYLTKKESDGVLHQMTWPPQSPDLNPIVWGFRLGFCTPLF